MEFCCKIAEFEEDWWTQPDSDEWDYDNHIWYSQRQTCSNVIHIQWWCDLNQ